MCVVILILIVVHKVKQLIGDATQERAPRRLIPGVAGSMGGVGPLLPLMAWDFMPEQACKPVKLIHHLKEGR